MKDIKYEYDDEEGTFVVSVISHGQWVRVAAHCTEEEADDCVADLCRWKRGE